jgi:hypothetical protein
MPDQLTIEKGRIVITTEEGQRVERPETQLLEMLRGEFVPPLREAALPDGVKFYDWRPPFFVVVHQLPPHVRQVRWIADDSPVGHGPGTTYRKVRLSLPYTVTFAVYAQQGDGLFLIPVNELYFRNEPVRSRADRLGYPALLNVSRIQAPRRERAWICTQYLRPVPGVDWTGQLQALLDHTWNGGFNRSSEAHEGASWYGASVGIHPELHPVEKWEQASAAIDAFGLSVPWKPAPLTVAELIDCLFEEQREAAAAHLAKGTRRPKPSSLVSRFLNFIARG